MKNNLKNDNLNQNSEKNNNSIKSPTTSSNQINNLKSNNESTNIINTTSNNNKESQSNISKSVNENNNLENSNSINSPKNSIKKENSNKENFNEKKSNKKDSRSFSEKVDDTLDNIFGGAQDLLYGENPNFNEDIPATFEHPSGIRRAVRVQTRKNISKKLLKNKKLMKIILIIFAIPFSICIFYWLISFLI